MRKKLLINVLSVLFLITLFSLPLQATSELDPMVEIGDITRIDGVRDNQLIGYGLVVGLAGTGDSNRSQATVQSVANMLENFGVEVTTDQIRSQNLAAVIVTADLPPFVRNGDKIDVTVSSLGDADSLQGGTLLQTPLRAANGEIFAVAQGAVSIGGFNIQAGGAQARENHPTVGRMPDGAIVERELRIDLNRNQLTYLLNEPHFETARRIADKINEDIRITDPARATDAGEVLVEVPSGYRNDIVDYISRINQLEVRAGMEAKVVIDEKTGTIVLSHNVRMSTVAVSHGNISITITTEKEVSQPPSFSEGETVETEETEIDVEEEEGHMIVLDGQETLEDLVHALNLIGASPRDIISIIQKIKAAGALHARIELL